MITLTKSWLKLLIFLCSLPIFSQHKEKRLEAHLKEIETHFGVSFNYESGLIKGEFCASCKIIDNKSLQYHTSLLAQKFRLEFTEVTQTKIVISAKKLDKLVLINAENGNPIVDVLATDHSSSNNWVSNSKGEIYFDHTAPKKIRLSHLNYGKQIVASKTLKNDTVRLQRIQQNLDELFLVPYFTNGTYKSKEGNFYIKSKKIETLAGLTSHDVIKSLENLPQVMSNSESTADLIINGGTQDQNLFLWNDIKVYQNHHFFGLISAFNENLISKISLYDNATPSKYGNSTSGVISLEHDPKISEKIKAGFGANFLSLDAYIKVPLSKKMEFQISTRKSLTETWKSPTYLNYSKKIFQSSLVKTNTATSNEDIVSEDEFRFKDVQLQYTFKPNTKNTLNLNGIYLENNLSYVEEDVNNQNSKQSDLEQQNWALGAQWERVFRNNSALATSLNYSKHSMYGGNFLLSNDIASKERNGIENFETKLWYQSKIATKGFNYNAGVSYDYLTIDNNTTNFNSLFVSDLQQKSAIYSAFGTVDFQSNKVYAKIGMRNVYYDFLKTFKIEPRFLLTYIVDPLLYFQLRAEQKTQNISQIIDLENNFLGIEKRRWRMANNSDAPLQQSNQLELSLNFKSNRSIFNLAAYTKKVNGITTNNQGFQNLNQFENSFGEYNIYGIQSHYSFKSKYLNAWISHNYSVNKYAFKNLSPSVFYNNNDVRTRLIAGINFKYQKFNISVGAEYNSGKPFTTINSEDPIIEGVFNTINYNSPNNARMAYYLRLDATLSYTFNLAKNTRSKITMGVINLADRKNMLSRYYTLTTDRNAIEVLDRYGLEFTPNLAWNIDF